MFQSTHPARGATPASAIALNTGRSFNPRTPRGVRRARRLRQIKMFAFQSTHPARGATTSIVCRYRCHHSFQSTHPARGATNNIKHTCFVIASFNPRTPRGVRLCVVSLIAWAISVSIHAPRAGCDLKIIKCISLSQRFNPRTPRGVRRSSSFSFCSGKPFQSTHPARGATLPSGASFSTI